MPLETKLYGQRLYLKKLPQTFKQSEEYYALIKKNIEHLFPFADWEIEINSSESCYDKITTQHKNWKKGSSYTYGIFEKTTSKLIGIIFACHFSLINKDTELGYWLDIDYCGKGYMKEAITILEKELFDKGINKIIIKTDIDNKNSEKLAKALGYIYKGTLTKDQFIPTFNELRDFNIFTKFKKKSPI